MSKPSSNSRSKSLIQGELFAGLPSTSGQSSKMFESMTLSIKEKLRRATKPVMIQVAPGKWIPAKGEKAPDMTISYWSLNVDGTYSPSPVTSHFVRLTGKLVKHLGFDGKYNTLYRLGRGGFVEIIKAAPNTMFLNIESFYNHLRRCAEDPFYWDKDGKAIREYRKTI